MDLSLKTWHSYSVMDFPTVNVIFCPHITKRSWSNDLSFTVCLCLFIQCVFFSLKVICSSKCTDKSKATPPLFHFQFNCLFRSQGNRIISIINNRERLILRTICHCYSKQNYSTRNPFNSRHVLTALWMDFIYLFIFSIAASFLRQLLLFNNFSLGQQIKCHLPEEDESIVLLLYQLQYLLHFGSLNLYHKYPNFMSQICVNV